MRYIFSSLELEWIEGNHLFGLQLQIQFGREFENANLSKWVIKQFIKPLRYFASAMLNSLCLVGKKPFCLGSESELIWTEFKGTVSMPWRWIGSKGIWLDPALFRVGPSFRSYNLCVVEICNYVSDATYFYWLKCTWVNGGKGWGVHSSVCSGSLNL
jgi:hypothetical protein